MCMHPFSSLLIAEHSTKFVQKCRQATLGVLFASLVSILQEGQRPTWEIQHRFTRMFPELRNIQYSGFRTPGLWTLEERRNRADLIEVFKILNGFSVVTDDTFFALGDDIRTRCHSKKLLKRRCNKDLRHHFFSERVVNSWNKLPSYTVKAKSVN